MAVICDGVGGLQNGEIASGSVVTAFGEWFCSEFPMLLVRGMSEQELERLWKELIYRENKKIIRFGEERNIKLGTTITAVLFWRDKYFVIHVGDCRLYQINEKIEQLTKDHTFIAKQIELQKMTVQEAEKDARKNMLLQCVGVVENIQPDFYSGTIAENSIYLLCTDGLRHRITEEEICESCSPGKNKDESMMKRNLQNLITVVKDRDEMDNISAIMIRTQGDK